MRDEELVVWRTPPWTPVIVEVIGKAAHASVPQEGVNAIDKMLTVATAIAGTKLKTVPHPVLGDYTSAFTTIQGGTVTNTAAGYCKATFDIRLIPGQTVEGVKAELQSVLDALMREDRDLNVKLSILPTPREVMETPADSGIVRGISDAFRLVTGREPRYGSGVESPGALLYLQQHGAHGVFFGPGSIAHAHSPNECVEMDRVVDAARIYAATIVQLMSS